MAKHEIPTDSNTKNDLVVREFEEIVVTYPPEDSCAYPEYKGKPYFNIKYKEGNDCFIGYGTYNPKVLSSYLRDYFIPSVTPQEPRWIPMVRREPTDEEKAEYLAQNGEELGYMLENEMPLNGQEVLVSVGEVVSEDIFDEEFFNFESNDIENVDAWMPLPKAYEPQESEDT